MASGQAYPSPNAAQIGSGAGPFYSQQQQNDGGLSPSSEPPDLQLSAELARSTAPELASAVVHDPVAHDAIAHGPVAHGAVAHGAVTPNQQLHHNPFGPLPSPQQVAQSVMSLGGHSHHTSFSSPSDTGSTNARKRTKSSRACDECRRKKSRCDSTPGAARCTPCTRNNRICEFNREPLKRGPNKGYIKELADRVEEVEKKVVSLEMQLKVQIAENQRLRRLLEPYGLSEGAISQLQDFAASPAPQIPRKRTHSMSEGLHDPYGSSQRLMNNTPHASGVAIQQYSPNGGMQPSWNQNESAGAHDTDPAVALLEWNEAAVDDYYRLVHPTLPFLPHSKNTLRARLANCSPALREAFLTALECAVRSLPNSKLQPEPNAQERLEHVAGLVAWTPDEGGGSRSMSASIVQVQTYIFMALESDSRGPSVLRASAGPPKSEWLGRAVGLAFQLRLNAIKLLRYREGEGDADADANSKLAYRVYWVLFVLDKWHAASTSSHVVLMDPGALPLRTEQAILGDTLYYLARLSYALGHVATANAVSADLPAEQAIMAPTSPATKPLGESLAGMLFLIRESMEHLLSFTPLLHLAYCHVHLLIISMQPSSLPEERLTHAREMIDLFKSPGFPDTPLNHHFVVLVSMTIMELADLGNLQEDAMQATDEFIELLSRFSASGGTSSGSGWAVAAKEKIWKRKQLQLSGSQAPLIGLQHLADAAVGERVGDEVAPGSAGGAGNPAATTPGTILTSTPSATVVTAAAAAAAAATAAAAQRQMEKYDHTSLTRRGYFTAFAQ